MNTYKECDFRKMVKLCTFKPEDCNPESCDWFNLKFSSGDVVKAARVVRKKILDSHKKMKKMKKAGEHKTNAKDYKDVKQQRNRDVKDLITIMKTVEYMKRIGK